MKRIQNMDKLRGVACLLVLLYHCYAITGVLPLDIPVFRDIVKMGGNVGVTVFFMLSGYGIYFSLDRLKNEQKLQMNIFMKARIRRIVPQYYFNVVIMLLLTESAVYLAKDNFFSILSHLFFFHSWSFAWHGAINGVLWTMSVIFQFYLIAVPLYKLLVKIDNIWFSAVFSILFTIFFKWLMLNYIWVEEEQIYGTFTYFIPGRQVITSLDNFVCGMCVAMANSKKEEIRKINKLQKIGVIFSLLLFIILCLFGVRYNIYAKSIWGYSWYSLLSIDMAWLMYSISFDSKNGIISKFLLFISKYEYGIYLWHLPIISNLANNSVFVKALIDNHFRVLLYFILSIATIPISVLIDSFFKKDNKRR